VQQYHFVVRQVLPGLARVVAIVAFAGQNDDQIAGARELFGARSDNVADAADDLGRLALGRPGGLLPIPHLGNADNRGWHRVIRPDASSSLTRTEAENQALAYRLATYLP